MLLNICTTLLRFRRVCGDSDVRILLLGTGLSATPLTRVWMRVSYYVAVLLVVGTTCVTPEPTALTGEKSITCS